MNPDKCSGPCDGNDIGDTPARGGIYGFDGQVAIGNTLEVSGMISLGQAPRRGIPLESPAKAEVHVAVAPHGGLYLSIVTEQLTTPIGSPSCGCWFVAFLKDAPSPAGGSGGASITPPSTGNAGLKSD